MYEELVEIIFISTLTLRLKPNTKYMIRELEIAVGNTSFGEIFVL